MYWFAVVAVLILPNNAAANPSCDTPHDTGIEKRVTERSETEGLDKRRRQPSLKSLEDTLEKIRWTKFVDQMIRVHQLSNEALGIGQWIYDTGDDELVLEFENVLYSLELSASLLRAEMESGTQRSASDSYSLDLVEKAKLYLDHAELTLDVLVGIALYGGN